MNKAELVQQLSKKTKMPKIHVETFLKATIHIIEDTVSKGDSVRLAGFGTFLGVQRKSRTGRNPQTGESINIPAKVMPKFRPGKDFFQPNR